ncbi:MAG: glutamate formimidoyltransferase [Anaerolineales bacterium]|nr:glutamate formimidoyltransferase [Anaerolineales bacterium]
MPKPIVECIANFSDARRPQVVEAIAAAISAVPGVALLDRHSDDDHNRTVLTFAGTPEGVEEAAFQAIRTAVDQINLDEHSGTHPRLGAADVIPFVPIAGLTMDDCVAIARRLGERVGTELEIPVYLYEQAATRPERVNLENIRRGQYEGLKAAIGTDPDRQPDFGPKRLGPAGATIIGARHPLIAYNVYLDTDDVSVAKSIAKTIRTSSGGFPCVKGLGMLVDGRAQVSMNLTNYRETSVRTVVEAIRAEAAGRGVKITSCELVGLIPQEALTEAAVGYLQLEGFEPDQILERRLHAALGKAGPEACSSFLDELAAGTPAPGGGAAAAHAGATGAALVAMVARLTIGKKKYAEVEAQVNEILLQAERLRAELNRLAEEDAAAFEAVMAAFRLPRTNADEEAARAEAIEAATLKATEVPLATAQKAVSVMAMGERAAALGNLNAVSDAAAAVAMGRAALTAAIYNVQINVNSLQDKIAGDRLLAQLETLQTRADRIEADLRKSLRERGGLGTA